MKNLDNLMVGILSVVSLSSSLQAQEVDIDEINQTGTEKVNREYDEVR